MPSPGKAAPSLEIGIMLWESKYAVLIISVESLSKFLNSPLIIRDICLEGTGTIPPMYTVTSHLAALYFGFKYYSSALVFSPERVFTMIMDQPLDFPVICVYLTICVDLALRTWAITLFKYPHYSDPLSIMSECLLWPTLTHYPTMFKRCPFLK